VAVTVPRGQGLAVGAEGHTFNVALGHGGQRLGRQPRTPPRVPQHHTPFADDLVPRRQGLAVGADGHAPNLALAPPPCPPPRRPPSSSTRPPFRLTLLPYPAARVLPSGLKARLVMLPSFACKNDLSSGRVSNARKRAPRASKVSSTLRASTARRSARSRRLSR